MSSLKRLIMDQVAEKGIQVDRLDRKSSQWWNSRRRVDDVRVFCGWYWFRGTEEGGPFPTPSSAYRDAYYKFVLEREPPSPFRRNVIKLAPAPKRRVAARRK